MNGGLALLSIRIQLSGHFHLASGSANSVRCFLFMSLVDANRFSMRNQPGRFFQHLINEGISVFWLVPSHRMRSSHPRQDRRKTR
jgi:hypothetical protein